MDSITHKELGIIKGNFDDLLAFKLKIDNAKKVKEYAQAQLTVQT